MDARATRGAPLAAGTAASYTAATPLPGNGRFQFTSDPTDAKLNPNIDASSRPSTSGDPCLEQTLAPGATVTGSLAFAGRGHSLQAQGRGVFDDGTSGYGPTMI